MSAYFGNMVRVLPQMKNGGRRGEILPPLYGVSPSLPPVSPHQISQKIPYNFFKKSFS